MIYIFHTIRQTLTFAVCIFYIIQAILCTKPFVLPQFRTENQWHFSLTVVRAHSLAADNCTLIKMKMHLDCVLRSRRSRPRHFCHAVNFTACPLKTKSLITQYPAGLSGSLLIVIGPFNQYSASVTEVRANTVNSHLYAGNK